MNHTISGEIAQVARLDFAPGEFAWASKGALMAYSKGITWRLRIPGGMSGAVGRWLAGEGVTLTYMDTNEPDQYALLASHEPGHIAVWDLSQGPIVTTRGAFLAAWGETLNITVTVAKRGGAALFGGAGLFLQRISGNGSVLVHGSGDFNQHQLAEGQEILVSTGNLAAFAGSVDYDIQAVGGCIKTLFGGEGLFVTRMRGPGLVMLQTLKRHTGRAAKAITT